MKKMISGILAAVSFTAAANTYALPIVQADAFATGDGKAALETSTGLVWMDFGINSNEAFASEMQFTNIVNNLSSNYKGWRLASEKEVTHLWFSLFDNQAVPVENAGNGESRLNDSDSALLPYFQEIADVFGYTWKGSAYINKTGEEGQSEFFYTKAANGYFYTDNAEVGRFSFFTPYTGVYPSWTSLETHGQAAPWIYGAMLVKDTSVPEPSSILLLCLGLFGLRFVRRSSK